MAKIYTRTGDQGETSLFTGQRVSKSDPFIDALGSIDECNSAIGSALSLMPNEDPFDKVRNQLIIIQHALFDVGAAVATPRSRAVNKKIDKTRFDEKEITLLEQWIDKMDAELPKLNTFILPGGHPSGAMLHLARSVCRRAERLVIPLNQHADVSDKVICYLNRLSDYLFVASRLLNHIAAVPETNWEQHLVTNEKG